MDPVLLGEILAVALFAATLGVVLAGYPVAFTLAGLALIFGAIGWGLGIFDPTLLIGLPSRYFGTMTSDVLVAVPLFVFMGVVLERSRIAEELLETMGALFGRLRGGLGISVILVGALLAASTGVVGATVVTMGLLSLPAMARAGYSPSLASGVITSSGTLGQIIPPSTVLIFLGSFIQVANQDAQLALGNFAPEPVSVGQLFLGALIPGLILVGFYVVLVGLRALFQPESAPAITLDAEQRAGLPLRVARALVPPLLLIVAVLGSILTGIANPTEAASVGAVGALGLAGLRGQLELAMLSEAMRSTLMITSMVFVILIGANVFSLVFRGLGGEELVMDLLGALPGGQLTAVFAVMTIMFLLGFFLDTFEIIFILVPITAPALIMLGVDPVWLGVMIGINLQTSFLTPPFGFALFYLRGVAGKLATTGQIYRGAMPFVALQLAMLALLYAFPQIATWLPEQVFGSADAPIGAPQSEQQFDDMLFGDEDDLMMPDSDLGFDDF